MDKTGVSAPKTRHMSSLGDPLEVLGVAPAARQILRYFLVRPTARPHGRELQRIFGLGGASLQRELERLVALGVLERLRDGNRVRYSPITDSRIWNAFRLLAGAAKDPTSLLRDAVADVPGVQAAFVFGSTARDAQREDSDIDLFVLEDAALDKKKLLRQLAEVELITNREVNAIRYTQQGLAERLGHRRHPAFRFIRDTLMGPKRWIAGEVSAILPVATAAGIEFAEPDAMS